MVSTVSYAMPAGVLGGLCAAMILFIWWWFPRTWKRGVAQENAELDGVGSAERREQAVSHAKSIIDNYRERIKQEQLAKSGNALSNEPGDIEAQNTTTSTELKSMNKYHSAHVDVAPATTI
ncbi:hypothetical protein LTR10_022630 [Elasticomyces elasticus]|uniref:SMP domain-containing protein n=1 Tax=Exophiala sideris TaxID=1016849 RepID=A0ABR0JC02_9EURO|nr:hypothetical protein LTR10_022630 [Elasticomyces elasticus]KAK5026159.1 hypothetical protein LTS07_007684 [Exophiala sideris]KAK5032413.1 hypothetical protein LTR13_007236 [Exophiala sideris]KAK5059569.1 hypothetical protein LTR69_006158 [Exophiala sideris]KAK5178148.1 hypothetical protein LTR44_009454 [Eurotiomycetes sp. CCFEE 6388]